MNPFEQIISAMAGVPVLSGARCRGRHALFDPQHGSEPDEIAQARHRQALALCAHCPALAACQWWVDSLPPRRRPRGVVAGRIIAEPKPGKRKAS